MLSQTDNEILTRVGPGTLMGNLLRRYWMPALLSTEVPEPDSPPVRVRLLGEDLVAFRDTDGARRSRSPTPARTAAPRCSSAATRRPACAASTTAGSSTSTGACVDMPSEPAESQLQEQGARQRLPDARVRRHRLDLHGPAGDDARLPRLRLRRAAARSSGAPSSCSPTATGSRRMEGNIDTSHISWLHQYHAAPRLRRTTAPTRPATRPTRILDPHLGPRPRAAPRGRRTTGTASATPACAPRPTATPTCA